MIARGVATMSLLLLAAVPGLSQTGPTADPRPDDPGATGCDNRCRMRMNFWLNGGSTCVRFFDSTCFLCVNNSLCTATEWTYGRPCLSTSGYVPFQYDDACTPLCDGWQGVQTGEATNMSYSGLNTVPRTITQSTCQFTVGGSPPTAEDIPVSP